MLRPYLNPNLGRLTGCLFDGFQQITHSHLFGILKQALAEVEEAKAALPPPFGPPTLQKPSYELLGDELLALGQKQEAAVAYRTALAAAPNRHLSVLGLKAAMTP
jgi:predicted negative regulator of RcsB-dependent stress response